MRRVNNYKISVEHRGQRPKREAWPAYVTPHTSELVVHRVYLPDRSAGRTWNVAHRRTGLTFNLGKGFRTRAMAAEFVKRVAVLPWESIRRQKDAQARADEFLLVLRAASVAVRNLETDAQLRARLRRETPTHAEIKAAANPNLPMVRWHR